MTLYTQATNSWTSCGMWHSSGICFFLRCTIYECHIETSPRYSMMLPDLVVSSFHDLDNHPYPLVAGNIQKSVLSSMSAIYRYMVDDSAGTRYRNTRVDKDIKFRDGDAVGHPGGAFVAPYLCHSAASNGSLYFSSFMDFAAWRNWLPVELLRPETWMPGMREVGQHFHQTWGNVFPRTGWLTQPHDWKLGAVLSQRMADIVTRPSEPHVYNYLSSGTISSRGDQTVFDPPPAMEAMVMGGQWQLSAPYKGVPPTYCHVFGIDDTATGSAFGDFQTSNVESYAFTLWRPYACCDTQGIFLYSIIWGMW